MSNLNNKIKFGIIGLGKMGTNLALQAVQKGYQVIGYDKYVQPQKLKSKITIVNNLDQLKKDLSSNSKVSRIIFIYIPAGKAIDDLLNKLSVILDKNDIIIDAGNSYWGDSICRSQILQKQDIYLLDCGTSGGPKGARNGACFMIGGNIKAVKQVEPILKDLAVPGGFIYTGSSGTGHFTKLVHNGIEFGMLQAIGEGIDLLENFKINLNIEKILNCWNHGTVIRSWLIELMYKMYKEKDGLTVSSYIEDTGEVNWLVEDALHMEIPIPVITQSVIQLIASRDQNKNWAKAIAMMRHGFGGHPFGPDKNIQHERKFGKIGCCSKNLKKII